VIQFANGVAAHALLSPRNNDIKAICERGTLVARAGGVAFELWRLETSAELGTKLHVQGAFPPVERASSTLRLIEDLVHALDTRAPPRGGARVAYANTELLFACIESHRRGGARVDLPLERNALRFARPANAPKQLRYEAVAAGARR
jgi:hypothetical protein